MKTQFVCQACGYLSSKWLGRCPECLEWNSFTEELDRKKSTKEAVKTKTKAQPITSYESQREVRISTSLHELDRVLGGGVVLGSLTLVGGDPGIGKSTLLLQVAGGIAKKRKVLYVSGEESPLQIKMRAERLGKSVENLYLLSETIYEAIELQINEIEPDVLIIDSIQTMSLMSLTSAAGSISQIREVTSKIMSLVKDKNIATFIVGHVTKSGSIAGPKVLEHIVDTVLYFEGDSTNLHRILRTVKNRFGSTNEIGIFTMSDHGLEEVGDPSSLFMSHTETNEPGTVIFPSIEGSRPLFVEIQSLVSTSNFGNPRRMGVGIDYNKLVMSIAILEKKRGLHLQDQDVYVNAVGGISLSEPAMTLPLMVSVASSFLNKPISPRTVIFGEVGLLGEVRSVPQIEKRIQEAKRLGYELVITPPHKNLTIKGIRVEQVSNLSEVFQILF